MSRWYPIVRGIAQALIAIGVCCVVVGASERMSVAVWRFGTIAGLATLWALAWAWYAWLERRSRPDWQSRPARFVCPRCGKASSHPGDLEEGYCGWCHDWTAPPQTKIIGGRTTHSPNDHGRLDTH